ncbi:MAG: Fic family protein, partial [Candidatus Woesearchaeota archaeon]|nr:Fic family protein [Candidatus Woesearchaeota archaeon]
KKKKYYLSHSYRIGSKVKKIQRYLGSDLNDNRLNKLKNHAEKLILEQLKKRDILEYELTRDEIEYFRKIESKIKVEHFNKKDWNRFTEEFTYNTNAIEGSTVTFSEVKDLIDKEIKPENFDEIETINVASAVEFIKSTKERLSLEFIKKIHQICFNHTKSFAGRFRSVEVVIKDKEGNIMHQGASYNKVKDLLNELVVWYNRYKEKYPPLLLASVVHNQFEKIHPFQDGNGRVGRLLLNYVLIKHKYPPVNIRLKDRIKYYETLRKYDLTGDIKFTIKFLLRQYHK